ncbi:hypothetical protein L6164_004023 [Bauhinia variegata]|uniref:Uncharacterized protein n=1 Tax=Bauhinia variegata TaxID=167791 RepID=A0ACB9Q3V4_BAUVA|nr:hypothetical protein L6164_004023 [Bauhinia variegata]
MEDVNNNRNSNNKVYNLFVKLLDGKTLTLRFPTPTLYGNCIKDRLYEVTRILPQHQRLLTGVQRLEDDKAIISCSPDGDEMFPIVHLLSRLAGGKGGFGSLLRGAATKAGQKKTNNFDACRDMSGRRLRHVNAEKRLEEWRAEEAERKLEKVAEEFLKKQAKKGKKGVGEGEAHKYVAKYREVSERCTAEVAESVKEALMSLNGKRKGSETAKDKADAKKLKIWMGKRTLNESDSEEDESNDEGENEKSVVLNIGNDSDSNKESECSPRSVIGKKQGGEYSGSGSTESGSEEEKETVLRGKVESGEFPSSESLQVEAAEPSGVVEPLIYDEKMAKDVAMRCSESVTGAINSEEAIKHDGGGAVYDKFDVAVGQPSNILSAEHVTGASISNDMEMDGSAERKASVHDKTSTSASFPQIEEPLNFDAINSAAELEVLGMERLKSELQARGLKCGGALEERAARLFLLKSTPLDKIPKKLLAKK